MIPKKFSHCCEGSEPHIRFPSLGIQQRDWESPENLALKTRGFDYKTFTGLGETEIPVLEGATKPCLNQDSEEKSSDPHRRVNMWRHGLAGVHHWDGGTSLGRSPLA